jgi:hypothetical protein
MVAGMVVGVVGVGLVVKAGTAAAAARVDAAKTATRMIRDDLVISGPPFRLGSLWAATIRDQCW